MATKETGAPEGSAYKGLEAAFNAYASEVNVANEQFQRVSRGADQIKQG